MNKVSIVVPIYNMGNKIETCVLSLINQTYKNIEIILVDDGSKDDSFERCKKLEMLDNRIRAFHTSNRGSGPARNYGIEHATGNYIYFPDADDCLNHDAIEKLEKIMRTSNCDLIVFGYQNFSLNGHLKDIKKYPDMKMSGDQIRASYSDYMTTNSRYGIQGAPWNKFFDLSLIQDHSIRYPSLKRHQDEGFIARYMCYVTQVCFISDVFYTYFSNDLTKEWDKYPTDYIEAVKGLYDERKTNILIWNSNDKDVHELIYKEYICGIIKALELSFSPKFGFNHKKRICWIKENIEDSELLTITIPSCLGIYQRFILKNIKKKRTIKVYIFLLIKVFMEKYGMVDCIKSKLG